MSEIQMCEMPKCQNPATVAQWDCCENYNQAGYYCSDCSWEGGTTAYCEWENYDLEGNLLAGSHQ